MKEERETHWMPTGRPSKPPPVQWCMRPRPSGFAVLVFALVYRGICGVLEGAEASATFLRLAREVRQFAYECVPTNHSLFMRRRIQADGLKLSVSVRPIAVPTACTTNQPPLLHNIPM